ncbi:MAG: VWA domain-containing protein [Phycisphaerales bacterium]|nr:VWA domain-containing protein [Phycisphaerales bacterium]
MRMGRIIPWLVSAAIHGCLAVLLLTVGIVALQPWQSQDDSPLLDGATFVFESPPKEPVLAAAPAAPASSSAAEPRATTALAITHARATSTRMRAKSQSDCAELTGRLDRPIRTADLPRSVLTIAGVRRDVAHRIVFLLDASGSMIGAYRTAAQEIVDAIARLNEEQQFAVVVFQRGEAFIAPPQALRRAGPTLGQHGLLEVKNWMLDEIVPGGDSTLLKAMRVALALTPDTIVIVSTGLLGAADQPTDRDALLAEFESLNPVDGLTKRRSVQIACIHLLQQEPMGALAEIARIHGGANSYRFIGRMADIRGSHDAADAAADDTMLRLTAAAALLKSGNTAQARTQFLRIGLGEPLHSAAPSALVGAAEIALLNDHDSQTAARLAHAAMQGARAFGLRATEARAESVLRAANDSRTSPSEVP